MSTFPNEHEQYLKSIKREKRVVCFFRIFIFLSFLILWELLVRFSILNSFFYSSPTKILETFFSLLQNENLLLHIGITTWEVLFSFFLASFLGTFIAFLFWRYPLLAKIFDPYITILNSLPKVALGPLIIIWIGTSIHSIIFMAITISVFTTIIHIYNGFLSTEKNLILLLKSFRAKPRQIFLKVVFPSNIDVFLSTLKTNISLSLIGVIMGELLVSKSGLGYLIMYGSQVFNLDLVICSIFVLGILSYSMYFILDQLSIILQKKRQY